MKKILIFLFFIFLISLSSAQNYYYFTPSQIYKEDYEKFFARQDLNLICNKTKNFIVYIDPIEGCQPQVVRSDLLEEQQIPIFCKLKAINLNPLLDNIYIKSVSITTVNKSDIVSGIIFHSPYIGEKYLAKYLWDEYGVKRGIASFDNLGYAVVILNSVPESKMPERVDINATARILYSAGFLFGIDRNSFLIPELSKEEWKARFNEFSFFNGKGFIKVNSIKENSVEVEIYKESINDPTPIKLILTKNNPAKINFWGFFCDNQEFEVILEDIIYPKDYARLIINGKEYLLAVGEKEEGCKVISIEKGILSGSGKVIMNCEGETFTLSIEPLIVKIKIDGKDYTLGLGDKIKIDDKYAYLIWADSDKKKLCFYLGDESKDTLNKVKSIIAKISYKDLSCEFGDDKDIDKKNIIIIDNNNKKIDNKEVTSIEIFELYEKRLKDETEKAYQQAKEKYFDIFFKYKEEKDKSGEYIGAIALYNLADLAKEIGKYREAINILSTLIKEYEGKDSGIVIKAENLKRKLIKFNYFGSKKTIEKNGKIWTIELLNLEFPSSFDSYVELKVNDIEDKYWIGEVIGEGWIVSEIKENNVVLENKNLKQQERREIIHIGEERCIEAEEKECKLKVKVINIKIKKAAKITVKPPEMDYISETNFSIHIGIEKRAIKIAPEKALEMAKKLNETAKKLEEFNKRLGKVVENWKKACYIGGTALFLKNFIDGLSGESIARKIAMRGTDGKSGWTVICNEKIKNGEYKTISECFREEEEKINKDVEKIKNLIDKINEKIKNAESSCEQQKNQQDKEKCIYKKISESYSDNELREFISTTLPELSSRGYFIRDQLKDFLLELDINYSDVSEELKKIFSLKIERFITSSKQLESHIKDFPEENIIDIEIDTLTRVKAPLLKIEDPNLEKLKNLKECCNGNCENLYYFKARYNNKIYYIIVNKSTGKPVIQCVLNESFGREEGIEKIEEELKKGITIEEMKCVPIAIPHRYASFYDRGIQKDKIGYMPIEKEKGWYIFVENSQDSYLESGVLKRYYLCNVGPDGTPDFALYGIIDDDSCIEVTIENKATISNTKICDENIGPLINKAESCVAQANSKKRLGKPIDTDCGKFAIKKQVTITTTQCEDFLSPTECRILFNLCDPVLCPPSRCDLGGRYPVDNVVQTGIIGSLVLCLPNFEGGKGVIMPICLTGLHAGLEFLNKMLKETVKCLEVSVQTGQNIGICDQIKSIYICEMLWNQLFPFIKAGIPNLLEKIERKGGGEYAKFSTTWKHTFEGLQYFYQVYGATATEAFKIRSTSEVGSMICKKFLGVRYPNAASLLEEISKPDLPYQFFAKVDEIPYTTITYPPQSHYKVFYIIYSGEQDIWYSIYLKNPPQYTGIIVQPYFVIDAGFLPKGQSLSKSPDFIAVSGYKEICVNINGREYCGFEVSSTSYAVNFLQDKYIEQQLKANIKTAKECKSGKAGLIDVKSLINIQQGVTKALSPAIHKEGIIRVCSTFNPGKGDGEENWKAVGYCDDPNVKCWVYLPSIKQAIKDLGLENQTLEWIEKQHKEIVKEIEMPTIKKEEIEKISVELINKISETIKNTKNYIEKIKTKKENIESKIKDIENTIKESEEKINLILDYEKRKEIDQLIAELYKQKTLLLYYFHNWKEKEEEIEKEEEEIKKEEGIEFIIEGKKKTIKLSKIKVMLLSGYKDIARRDNKNKIVNYDDKIIICPYLKINDKYYGETWYTIISIYDTQSDDQKLLHESSSNPLKDISKPKLKFYWYNITPVIKEEGYKVYGYNNKTELIKYKQELIMIDDNKENGGCIEINESHGAGTYWYRVVVEIDEKYNISTLGRPATEKDIEKFEKMLDNCVEKIKNRRKNTNKEELEKSKREVINDIKKDYSFYLEPDAYEGCVGISRNIMRISRREHDSHCKGIKGDRCKFLTTIFAFKTVPFAWGVRFYDENDPNAHHSKNFMAIDCINLLLASLTYSTEKDLYKEYLKNYPHRDLFHFYIAYILDSYETYSPIIGGPPYPESLYSIYEENYPFNDFSDPGTLKSGDVLLWAKEITERKVNYDDTLILLWDNNNQTLDRYDRIIRAANPRDCKLKKGIEKGSLCISTLNSYTNNLNANFTIVKSMLLE